MNQLQLSEIANVLQGRLVGTNATMQTVSIDTRNIQPGDLYIAIQGERYDGHDFSADAVAKGAAALMVQHQQPVAVPQIIVGDTRKALGQLAKHWRLQYDIPVLAVTGSNGKTTVKEMLASILNGMQPTLVTSGNLNNEIGVPLTLLRLRDSHRYAVVELGANHPGEIRYLAGLALPSSALITNAGPAHLEGFGSINGVAHAKAEIFEPLGPEQTAVVNADDKYAPLWRELTAQCKRIEFGLNFDAVDVGGVYTSGENLLQIKTADGTCEVQLPVMGKHNARNALAAAAMALTVGADLSDIKQGLERMRPVKSRLHPRAGIKGLHILDDSYNANPASLEAALEVVAAMPGEAWLILGDMLELGDDAERVHAEIGGLAKRNGISRLFTLGKLSALAAQSFGPDAKAFSDVKLLTQAVLTAARPKINVLIKGSRSMRMEKVVAALLDSGSAGAAGINAESPTQSAVASNHDGDKL